MSTLSYTLADSSTMLRRNLRKAVRYPTVFLFVIGIPIVLMLLFVYVFGGTLGAGLGPSGTRADYINYLVPGILVLSIAGAGQGIAISVAMDMSEGIIARFKTMAISRSSVLMGHVLGSLIQGLLAIGVVVGVAYGIGFRPNANPLEWVAAFGVLTMVAVAIIWLCVAAGLVSKSVETASNLPMPLLLLPFFGSGFAPTDSMPTAVRWFAENQPFTPFTETLRGLLLGTAIGNDGYLTIAWCVGLTAFGHLSSRKLYDRDPTAA